MQERQIFRVRWVAYVTGRCFAAHRCSVVRTAALSARAQTAADLGGFRPIRAQRWPNLGNFTTKSQLICQLTGNVQSEAGARLLQMALLRRSRSSRSRQAGHGATFSSRTAGKSSNCGTLTPESAAQSCTMVKKSFSAEKREIPGALRQILAVDIYATSKFCAFVERFFPLRTCYSKYTALEISCHGIPWLAGWLAFIWLWYSPRLFQMQVNFYIGLLLDIIVVAVLKSMTRRRRPASNKNDMFVTVSVDKFSFPSGHATRACFIAYFFNCLYPVSSILRLPLLLWAGCVCVSRVLLHRHHLLDVFGGAIVGILEGVAVSIIWLSPQSCLWLLSMLTDERLDGGEYHV